jgi:hypothetical protein
VSADLVEIKCPYNWTSKKNGKSYPCNRPVVRVSPGSYGEAYCQSCKKTFKFDVGGSLVA